MTGMGEAHVETTCRWMGLTRYCWLQHDSLGIVKKRSTDITYRTRDETIEI